MKLKYWEVSKLIKLRALAWTSWVKKAGSFAIRLLFRGNSVLLNWNFIWLENSKAKDSREMHSFQSQDNQVCLMNYIILLCIMTHSKSRMVPSWRSVSSPSSPPSSSSSTSSSWPGVFLQACGHLESSIFLFPDQWGTDAGKHQVLCRYFNVKCFRLTILESSLLP